MVYVSYCLKNFTQSDRGSAECVLVVSDISSVRAHSGTGFCSLQLPYNCIHIEPYSCVALVYIMPILIFMIANISSVFFFNHDCKQKS